MCNFLQPGGIDITENFYRAFEDRYRGPRQTIKDRLKVYIPFVKPLLEMDEFSECLDLGCGRGEWLEITQELGFKSTGVDLDSGMLLGCKESGLNVAQSDAYQYLKSLKDNSQAVISAFHVVEHISFEDLQKWTNEALRVLKPGGLLIYETPNPENILVATRDFYLDPSHIKPIPPKLLSFVLEYSGFQKVKTLRLQEDKNLSGIEYVSIEKVLSGVSPDYAVIGQKSASEEILRATSKAFEVDYGISLEYLSSRFGNQLIATETKAGQALTAADSAETKAGQALSTANDSMILATEVLTALNAIYASKSWRITAPLRRFSDQLRLLRGPKLGFKSALKSAFNKIIIFFASHPRIKFLVVLIVKKIKLHPVLSEHVSRHLNFRSNSLKSKSEGRSHDKRKISQNSKQKKIAVLIPQSSNNVVGGAERFYNGLVHALKDAGYHTEIIGREVDESSFEGIQEGYRFFESLDLSEFDLVISTKAPTFAVKHPNHIIYLVHTVRVFYDMFESNFPAKTPELLEQQKWIQEVDFRAISRVKNRFAIGNEVSNRLLKWNDLKAEVLHPAIDLDNLYDGGIGDYFFMPGRLHSWKRVDLAINAVKKSNLPLKLVIAGSGESEDYLRELAGDDERIEFVGHVSDSELKNYYANSLAVPFLPIREDFGYITLEAFAAGKAVVTCLDSGEPTKFVEDGVTGLVCEPEVNDILNAFEKLWKNPGFAKQLGSNGRERARGITWPSVVDKILDSGFPNDNLVGSVSRKIKVVVLDMQPILPPVGGGRLRLLGLFHGLGSGFETRYVGSYDWPGESYRRHFISPTLEEIDIPLSKAHHKVAEEARKKAGNKVVIDLLFGVQGYLSSDYLKEAEAQVEWADVVVFSHPWVAPLIDDVLLKDKTIIYDSHNVEGILRESILNTNNSFEVEILDTVIKSEQIAGGRAHSILTCSQDDALNFNLEYGWEKSSFYLAPNGVFTNKMSSWTKNEKGRVRSEISNLSNDAKIGFFIGSAYWPNIEAATFIIETLANKCPATHFIIAGSVCEKVTQDVPKNVKLVGVVTEYEFQEWLSISDFGLNPMKSGSGTNIKMFDYMAASLPILSTVEGARGIVEKTIPGICVASVEEMATEINQEPRSNFMTAENGTLNKKLVSEKFSWEKISRNLGRHIENIHMNRVGKSVLNENRIEENLKIAHLTTLGTTCGIGEYTETLIREMKDNKIMNYVFTCDTAFEKARPSDFADRFAVAWYWDNKGWSDSALSENLIEQIVQTEANFLLIQYHPGFFSSEKLLSLVLDCINYDLLTSIVIHKFDSMDVDNYKMIQKFGVAMYSHSQIEVDLAESHGLQLSFVALGNEKWDLGKDSKYEKHNLSESIVITNGFLREHKGIENLIKAMPEVLKNFPKVKLRIQCPLYPGQESKLVLKKCETLVRELDLNHVVSIDTRFKNKKEMLHELEGADLAVYPYRVSNEGGSAAAADAMAVGLPIIVSEAQIFDSIREFAQTIHSDSNSIANSIISILSSESKYQKLKDASQSYTRKHTSNNAVSIYLSSLGLQIGTK